MSPREEKRSNRPTRGTGASRDGKKFEKRPNTNSSSTPRRGGAKKFENISFGEQKRKPREEGGFKSNRSEGSSARPYKSFEKKSFSNNSGSRSDSRDSRDSNKADFNPRFRSKSQSGDYKPSFNRFPKEDSRGGYKGYSDKPVFKDFKGTRTDNRDSKDRNDESPSDFKPRLVKKPTTTDRPSFNRFSENLRTYKETRFDEGKKMRPRLKNREEDDTLFDPNAKYSKKKQLEHQKKFTQSGPCRLNKFLANAGFCSRREADEYIKAGVVTVNGEVVTEMGAKVQPTDKVLFHDQLVRSEKKVYVLLNKPKDCVTTTEDTASRLTVMDLVKNACEERIYPVGRLDRNTTGVLLLTNDGDLAARLMHPKFEKKKIYHAFLDKALTKADMQQIIDGFDLEDGFIKADSINYVENDDKKQIGIEIHSGRNRLVRRIFEHLGYKVVRLDRVYFAGLTKKNLSRGQWRHLSEKEINILQMGAFE